MKFGIIAALDEELRLIKDELQDVSEKRDCWNYLLSG